MDDAAFFVLAVIEQIDEKLFFRSDINFGGFQWPHLLRGVVLLFVLRWILESEFLDVKTLQASLSRWNFTPFILGDDTA